MPTLLRRPVHRTRSPALRRARPVDGGRPHPVGATILAGRTATSGVGDVGGSEQFWTARANVSGKRALIAGGGGGLGKGCALDLGRAGMRLALCDKDEAALERTAVQLREEAGADVITAVLDVRDPDAVGAFFAAVDEPFGGGLDVLVNVVGGTWFQPFADSTPKGWDTLIRTNYTWVLHAIHLAIPRMRAAGAGSIINITSSDAHRGVPGVAVYTSMKAAVTHLGRTLAIELGPERIRINTIAMADVPTEGVAGIAGRDGGAGPDLSVVTHNRMGVQGTVEDIGSAALFLASDLSRIITGTTVNPDGGVLA